ncbi:GNAT family N-acetyltransferase [Rhodococcoides trifolii]|uniref:GNAT family N-acetyltransferase n=1 Tax=Rhodococcoides trifolii TaxID=908250 RepID=UPI001E491EB9|nr:GNAT family N-acetyltransferase [Rhodococcus trifolii]
MRDYSPLDTPVRSALDGAHSRFRVTHGNVAGYQRDVAPFIAHPLLMADDDWADLAALGGPGVTLPLIELENPTPPSGWRLVSQFGLVQMTGELFATAPEPDATRLGRSDVPDILDLVARTKPGPFLDRTIELGTYLGIRRDGRLIAMAGERMHPAGWTEISAVCTDPDFRGEGLATRLMRAVGAGIVARGETPFLHASAANVGAIRLYTQLGFDLRKESVMTIVETPRDA